MFQSCHKYYLNCLYRPSLIRFLIQTNSKFGFGHNFAFPENSIMTPFSFWTNQFHLTWRVIGATLLSFILLVNAFKFFHCLLTNLFKKYYFILSLIQSKYVIKVLLMNPKLWHLHQSKQITGLFFFLDKALYKMGPQ